MVNTYESWSEAVSSGSQSRPGTLIGIKSGPSCNSNSEITSSWWFQPNWKNISPNENLPQIGVKIKDIWNHQPDMFTHFELQILYEGIQPSRKNPLRHHRATATAAKGLQHQNRHLGFSSKFQDCKAIKTTDLDRQTEPRGIIFWGDMRGLFFFVWPKMLKKYSFRTVPTTLSK